MATRLPSGAQDTAAALPDRPRTSGPPGFQIRGSPSPVTICFPSGDQERHPRPEAGNTPGLISLWRLRPWKIPTVRLFPSNVVQVSKRLLSGDHATTFTKARNSRWRSIWYRSTPVSVFQTRVEPSWFPQARWLPSGEAATLSTEDVR